MLLSAAENYHYRIAEIGTVIAPYDATSSEQLPLQLGQLIQIRRKTDTGWWEGELQVSATSVN